MQKKWCTILTMFLLEFCRKWKMMATAADEYVKKWECEKGQKQRDKVGTSSSRAHKTLRMKENENPLECAIVKPILHIEKRELQISSAMEVIKGVYRDLFQWGDGKWMQIKAQFANEKDLKDFGCLNENFNCQNPDENMDKLYKEKLTAFENNFNSFFM